MNLGEKRGRKDGKIEGGRGMGLELSDVALLVFDHRVHVGFWGGLGVERKVRGHAAYTLALPFLATYKKSMCL